MGTPSCVEWLAWGVLGGLALVVSEVPTHTPIVIPAKAGIAVRFSTVRQRHIRVHRIPTPKSI
jgi:hypothetical protein